MPATAGSTNSRYHDDIVAFMSFVSFLPIVTLVPSRVIAAFVPVMMARPGDDDDCGAGLSCCVANRHQHAQCQHERRGPTKPF
jgi:hypothetical protein